MNLLKCLVIIADRISHKTGRDREDTLKDICTPIPENKLPVETDFNSFYEVLIHADFYFQKIRKGYTQQIDPTLLSQNASISGEQVADGILRVMMKESFTDASESPDHMKDFDIHYLHLVLFTISIINTVLEDIEFERAYERTCVLSDENMTNMINNAIKSASDAKERVQKAHSSLSMELRQAKSFIELVNLCIPELNKKPNLFRSLLQSLEREFPTVPNFSNEESLEGFKHFLYNWRSEHQKDLNIVLH